MRTVWVREAMGVGWRREGAVERRSRDGGGGAMILRALWPVFALVVVLVCGLGCGRGKARLEKPRLDPWSVPVAEVPLLLSGDVEAIAVDGNGALWFGTRGGGVSRYDSETGAWTTFTEKDGLADNN